MTKEHTHTPWIIEYGSEESAIIDARGYIICTNGEDPSVVSDDEMDHIVKCVNMHDELVEVLSKLMDFKDSDYVPNNMFKRAEKTLKKAGAL